MHAYEAVEQSLSGRLHGHLADLNEQAQNRYRCIVCQMMEAEGVTEDLKLRSKLTDVCGIEKRGFDAFCVDGRQIKVDITDFSTINMEELFSRIEAWKEEILHD